jgi:hypothetical protein
VLKSTKADTGNQTIPILGRDRSDDPDAFIPEDAFIIIGAGQFGSRAARILIQKTDSPILIIDLDQNRLDGIKVHPIERIVGDGIWFLIKNFDKLGGSHTIIPAVPLHLAFEWLKGYLEDGYGYKIKQINVPADLKKFLPHTWDGREGSLLVSYADFQCPDDCPEPDGYCLSTGEKREFPLFQRLSKVDLSDYRIHIIRSRQLMPGLGGYPAGDLKDLMIKVQKQKAEKWLLGSACSCHGVLTAFEISTA